MYRACLLYTSVWPVDEGTISVGGVDLTRMPEHKRAKYIGRVFQDPMMGTAATMQIEENLALAARRGQSRTLRAGITRACLLYTSKQQLRPLHQHVGDHQHHCVESLALADRGHGL